MALSNADLHLRDALAEKGPLQEFLFDRRLHGAGDAAQEPMHTALADSLREVLVRGGGEQPAAIVVLTDGRDNASKLTLQEAAEACRDKGVPLYIYGVGSSHGGVLQIKDVSLPCEDRASQDAETGILAPIEEYHAYRGGEEQKHRQPHRKQAAQELSSATCSVVFSGASIVFNR